VQQISQLSRAIAEPSGIEAVLYEIRDAVKTAVDLLNKRHVVIQPIITPVSMPAIALLGRLIRAAYDKTFRGHPGALVVPGSNKAGPVWRDWKLRTRACHRPPESSC